MTRIRRRESHLEGTGGVRLLRRSWTGEVAPRRVLVVVHGLGEHSARYDELGAWFAGRGLSVTAYDHRGHGLSGGLRGHIASFGELLDDLATVLRAAAEEHPELPVTLVGHSMGGLVVAAFLRERRPDVESAVLSGAALAVNRAISPIVGLGVRSVRRILPRAQREIGVDPKGLARDASVGERYAADPLVLRRMTLSMMAELLETLERTAGGAADVEVPTLLLHGADDPICPVGGSHAFFEALRSPGSAFRSYPRLRHEIFNEREAEAIFEEILEWLERREGGRLKGTRRAG